MGIVSSRDDEERNEESGASGQLVDFDFADPELVKVYYDLSAWTFDQRGELSELLADRDLPHDWAGDEIVVPEAYEADMDAIFEELEARFGPFPVVLDAETPSMEFGLDEWTTSDRNALNAALVDAQVPHRWDGTTLVVAADAEDTVDGLLDAIEAGELVSLTDDGSNDPPDGILSTLFGAADELARDPLDLRSREELVGFHGSLDPDHPPFAFAQRTWVAVLSGIADIVAAIDDEARDGIGVDADGDEDDPVAQRADELRRLLRPYV
jgi:hypothetical protein